MEPRIVETQQMLLVGFSFFGDPFEMAGGWSEENEIGRTWTRFMSFLEKHRASIKHVVTDAVAYEVHVHHEETAQTGEFEVFVGLEVEDLEDVPVQLTVKVLPPATYAAFTLHGEQIVSDWSKMVFAEWLPQAGYEGDHSHSIQRYDERFKGLDPIDESVLEIYIPVRSREPGDT
jgi:predicted transcriptional regulator YdeE